MLYNIHDLTWDDELLAFFSTSQYLLEVNHLARFMAKLPEAFCTKLPYNRYHGEISNRPIRTNVYQNWNGKNTMDLLHVNEHR
jgi:glycerol kinase